MKWKIAIMHIWWSSIVMFKTCYMNCCISLFCSSISFYLLFVIIRDLVKCITFLQNLNIFHLLKNFTRKKFKESTNRFQFLDIQVYIMWVCNRNRLRLDIKLLTWIWHLTIACEHLHIFCKNSESEFFLC